jgi:hypothetical protein
MVNQIPFEKIKSNTTITLIGEILIDEIFDPISNSKQSYNRRVRCH